VPLRPSFALAFLYVLGAFHTLGALGALTSFVAFVFITCNWRELSSVFVAFAFQSCDWSELTPVFDTGEKGVFGLRGLA